MIDDEIDKLMVVNKKILLNIVSLSGISLILQNPYIKMYYIMYWDCIMLFTRLYLLSWSKLVFSGTVHLVVL